MDDKKFDFRTHLGGADATQRSNPAYEAKLCRATGPVQDALMKLTRETGLGPAEVAAIAAALVVTGTRQAMGLAHARKIAEFLRQRLDLTDLSLDIQEERLGRRG